MASNTSLCRSAGFDPIALSQFDICLPGFYCPNNTAIHPPQFCQPTTECYVTRLQLQNNVCPEPQGIYEPVVCKAGHYCPPGGKEQILCPEGHYCPLGATKPVKCLPLSICPPKSGRELPLIGILLCGLLDALLIGMSLWPIVKRYLPARMIGRKLEGQNEICLESQLASSDEKRVSQPESSSIIMYDRADAGLAIGFRDVTLVHPTSGRKILDAVSGIAPQGCLLGILGHSGSGKTTLINVLAGQVKRTSGAILWNGVEQDMSRLGASRGVIKFVPQDDIVHPHLTVWENILHSARVQLGGSRTDESIQGHVQSVINALGLVQIQDSVVGNEQRRGISGGERKRVNIALELVASPPVLILDEPTSGLDAQAALSITKLLKKLAGEGMTVLCVIHQPRVEIFETLDSVLILDTGRQIYSGPASLAKAHFEGIGYKFDPMSNPADVILDIASGCCEPMQFPDIDRSAETSAVTSTDHNKSSAQNLLQQQYKHRTAQWHKQVSLCFYRDIKQQFRQLASFWTEIFAGSLTGLLLGLALHEFQGQFYGGLYLAPFTLLSSAVNYIVAPEVALFTCFCITFASAAPSVIVFGEEVLISQRESRSGHSTSAYFVGKSISCFLRCTLSALHFTSFYVLLATPLVRFQILFALNLVFFYCVYGIGSVVAAITQRENGPLVCFMATIIVSVLSGTEPRLAIVKQWHMAWLWYLLPGTWFSEAYVNEHISPFSYLYRSKEVAEYLGYTFGRTGFDVGLAILIGTMYRVIGCLLMTVRARTGWW